MNRIQYRRWKDFALRMADMGWPNTITRTKQHKEIVRPAVEHFFELIKWNNEPVIIRILSWDHSRDNYRNAEKFVWGFRPQYETCVCDEVDRIINEYWNPYYYSYSERLYYKWDDLWGSRIHCCIRAGLDLVTKPSGGVIGFCKEDIERMYPEGVPKWIREPWEYQNGTWRPIQWDDIKSDDSLWL